MKSGIHINSTKLVRRLYHRQSSAFSNQILLKTRLGSRFSLGGDSDTIAAITGAIAEAYYGVPDAFRQQAFRYLDDDLLSIYNEWESRARVNNNGRFFWALTKYIGRFIGSDPYGLLGG